MKVIINGCGIAGPALAWVLREQGHEPMLLEKASAPRTGGYVVDFWGTGYDIAEAMGVLPGLKEDGYVVEELRNVTRSGRIASKVNTGLFQSLTGGRYLSVPRSALSARLVEACSGIPIRYGCHVEAIEPRPDGVGVTLSDGSRDEADLVIGADGLHSGVRGLTFGPEKQFERFLGLHVAAVELAGYRPRDPLVYITHTLPGRQIARFTLNRDRTLVLMVFDDRFLPREEMPKADILRAVYGDMGWEAPAMLEALSGAGEPYLDRVSQIRMETWHRGRVALIGDAAGCASLLAGEGSGLAIASAWVLGRELGRKAPEQALADWQARIKPWVERKQAAALKIETFFAPKSWGALYLRDIAFNLARLPGFGRMVLGGVMGDEPDLIAA